MQTKLKKEQAQSNPYRTIEQPVEPQKTLSQMLKFALYYFSGNHYFITFW